MTFLQSLESCLRQYAIFHGRASRSEYAWFFLFYFLCTVGSDMLGRALEVPTFAGTYSLTFISLAVLLILLLPSLAVVARRLHDFDYSAAWVPLILVPGVNIILALCLFFVKGNTAANQFGEPPSA